MIEKIEELISKIEKDVIEWQRYFHMYPEISFKEFNTTEKIIEILAKETNLKIEKLNPTGIIATLEGNKPGKTIAIRADIDALQILEENDHLYCSKNNGVMHACGHDGHIAILLGAAICLYQLKEHISGKIKFIFQAAEEMLPGGAIKIVEKGYLKDVDFILGYHLDAFHKTGTFGIKEGPIMASTDNFEIRLLGNGGHAAFPELSKDLVFIGAKLILEINSIIAKNIPATDAAVITPTIFNGSSSFNVIPKEVIIGGTIRTLNQEVRKKIKDLLKKLLENYSKNEEIKYYLFFYTGHEVLENDTKLSKKIKSILEETFLEENVYEDFAVMGGEDFSNYLKDTKGCYFKIGGRKEKNGKVYPHHNSKFELDEKSFIMGVQAILAITNKLMIEE